MELKHTGFEGLLNSKLYEQFTLEAWKSHSVEERQLLYQEVENREGRLLNRPVREIKPFMPRTIDELFTMGYVNTAENDILHLNVFFMTPETAPIKEFTGAKGLETVLHEGRHGYQEYCIMPGVQDRHTKKKKKWTWLLNDMNYCPPEAEEDATEEEKDKVFALYQFQPLELDARRYARQRMRYFAQQFESGSDPDFTVCINNSVKTERRAAAGVLAHLGVEIFAEAEKKMKDVFRAYAVAQYIKNGISYPIERINRIPVFAEAYSLLLITDALAECENLTRGLKSLRMPTGGSFEEEVPTDVMLESIEEMYCRKVGLPDPISIGAMPELGR